MKHYGILLIKGVESAFPGDVNPGLRFYDEKKQRDDAACVLYHGKDYSRDNDVMVAIDMDENGAETYSFTQEDLTP